MVVSGAPDGSLSLYLNGELVAFCRQPLIQLSSSSAPQMYFGRTYRANSYSTTPAASDNRLAGAVAGFQLWQRSAERTRRQHGGSVHIFSALI